MKKSDFHIYNSSFIYPLLNSLEKAGESTGSLISTGNIKRFEVYNPETYIPLRVLYDFLVRIRKDVVVDNLANTFYSNFNLADLGEYGEFLSECPDLLTVILEGIKYEHMFQTNTRMKLDIKGAVTRFYTVMLDPPSEGRRIAEEIAFAMLYQGLKMVLGDKWKPQSIQLASNTRKGLEQLLALENVKVEYGCPYYGITFPTALLIQSNSIAGHIVMPPSGHFDTFSDSIYHTLRGFGDGYIPTITDFSTYFGVSERTITRTLVSEGSTFSSLIQRYLFSKSLKLLSSDKLTVGEIGERLGYANASNFLRAFKGWTKRTPEIYRHEFAKIS